MHQPPRHPCSGRAPARSLAAWLRAAGLALGLLACGAGATAQGLSPAQVPDPLKTWVPWVMHDQPDWACPHHFDDAGQRICAWPGLLALSVDGQGGRFSQHWHSARDDWAALPGEARWWPQDVLMDGKPAPVLDREGVPSVRLPAGTHRLEGRWRWSEMPESLALPRQAALLEFSLAGKPVGEPVRDDANRVWLGRQQSAAGQGAEQAQVQVHRRWIDGIPMRLETRVHLEVSGRSREVSVARSLLPGWTPQALTSPLPTTLAPDGSLRVQARAGVWDLTLLARHPGQVSALGLPALPGGAAGAATPLAAEEEVWVFAAAPGLRAVSLDGPPAVDPQQTTLPAEWRQLPAYLMQPGASLNLTEQRRGDTDPASDKLTLTRRAWLSFDGRTMTFHDRISGHVNQATRLEMGAPAQLGRADVAGEDQLITHGDSGLTGLELRRGELQLSADSLVTPVSRSWPAVGWRQDFEKVSMNLALPAGWRLLHAGGVDRAEGAWLSSWDLLDFFGVLMLSLAIGRLWGARLGAVAFALAVLSWKEPAFPILVWLPLLVAVALGRVIPDSLGQVRRVARWVAGISAAGLLLLCVQFAVIQVRTAMYPVLEQPQAALLDTVADMAPAPYAVAPQAPAPAALELQVPGGRENALDMKRSRTWQGNGNAASNSSQQAYRNADPNAKVQTGPGLPSWSWLTQPLHWDGPVLKDQVLTLWLLPPWVQKLLTVLRLALLVGLLVAVARRMRPGARPPADAAVVPPGPLSAARLAGWCLPALVLAGLVGAAVPPTHARPASAPPSVPAASAAASTGSWPDSALLDQLKARLTVEPDCLPACAELSRLTVQANGTSLRLGLEVDADRETAIPVPGGDKYWLPREVRSNGQPGVLWRGEDGRLWLRVSPGRQRVDLLGELPADSDTVQLPLLLKPRHVQVQAPGWDVEGLDDDGVADILQLTRQRNTAERAGAARDAPALPAYLRVERRLYLDLVWRVETTVRRESPPGVPALAQVPLLAGEAVTSGGISVKDGKVQVNLGPQADAVSWSSTLVPGPALSLSAASVAEMTQTPWAETWWIDASTLWHVALQGVPPAAGDRGEVALAFYPWPGETLALQISRPQPVAGQTLTVDCAEWRIKPGARVTDYELNLSLRSSRGFDHPLTLPEGASLQQVSINGQPRALRTQGRTLHLPVLPGKQSVELRWRVEQPLGVRYRTQALALGVDSVNHGLSLSVPQSRWLLWASGPGLGPAILFWGALLVYLGLGVVLARVGRKQGVPLRTWQWLLLMLGLTQVDAWAGAAVVGWFFAMALRGRAARGAPGPVPAGPPWRFNLGQLALAGVTLLMLGTLFYVVLHGLVMRPDMQVLGNGSSAQLLRWTQDRVGDELPPVTLITLPLLAYRGLMLAWALWLAWALLNWLRWGWGAWSAGALWRPRAAAVRAPAPMPAPAPPPTA
jgi:hypothetical protein